MKQSVSLYACLLFAMVAEYCVGVTTRNLWLAAATAFALGSIYFGICSAIETTQDKK